ncbi:unannotated protein [freshwater metagenome]|jgi:hypothetical protein|uniref:Unannotated protein n=1 Tax=freshwater metagenome TaxID=449393 RepID=A0A6J7VHZ5_9ZZZZ|nr:hypothetical protein [Actinomycetota bacterium]MSY51995.1 hypothetical protein [Actinomycetota bacterium]MSY87458.1 hypothetical protein [Actinomycetota bacterium]MTA51286.1 hypothetical protein [Actinomycetota bacterium]
MALLDSGVDLSVDALPLCLALGLIVMTKPSAPESITAKADYIFGATVTVASPELPDLHGPLA